MVPEVRIRRQPLATEVHGTHPGLCVVQPWLLQSVPWIRPDGRQRDEALHHSPDRGAALRAIRPRLVSRGGSREGCGAEDRISLFFNVETELS